jgi:hypothetical protein
MNKFYVLWEKGMRGEVIAFPDNITLAEFNVSQFLRNQLPDKEITFSASLGKKFFDFVLVSPGLNLISEKVYKLLMDNNITGWKGIPTIIHKHEDLKYYILTVTGRCGPLDRSKTQIVDSTKLIHGQTVKANQGLFFPEDSWDGSDMFVSEYVNFTFVTEKVKTILEKNKVTNVEIINTKEYQWLKV